jgi:mannitol 2-dehydrogenase
MTDPRIRIVSLTVTEGGYYIDGATGKLAVGNQEIRADAANPRTPKTFFGMIIKALAARRAAGVPNFAVLSCDNLPGNGDLTRACVTGLARLSDPGLADWIATEVAFPNSMVDCITPATTDRERNLVKEQFGLDDAVPVVCEPFRQWVIEDHFPSGRPPLERVGVEFVEDVARHELMKLRILNAGHASMCYAAALLGHYFVHDAMSDADIAAWLSALLEREAIPALQPLPGVDYLAYRDTVLKRFANPRIGDTIPRLAKDGSDRQPKFILPTLQDALDAGFHWTTRERRIWGAVRCRPWNARMRFSRTRKSSVNLPRTTAFLRRLRAGCTESTRLVFGRRSENMSTADWLEYNRFWPICNSGMQTMNSERS